MKSLRDNIGSAPMYKRLLIATDGSDLSERAIDQGVNLAKTLGASVVGLHAAPSFRLYAGAMADVTNALEEEYRHSSAERAQVCLGRVEQAAKSAGVDCHSHYTYGEPAHEAILGAAKEHKCDLVVMASHGRGSVGSLLLGSVTQKVLAHADLPVLVVR
jgi:nucleotide-binding universal stress UspA family protein